ncbi:hypothetical protein NX059_002985 [Plenodomus lindquistii]|nr:hypothetical protein NX059_002985 [Plenodomus lindquistii]
MSTRDSDKSKPYIPLASLASDGYHDQEKNEATATCFCGEVQFAFQTEGPGLLFIGLCHCTDCRKITASMFSSIFAVAESTVKFIRGKSNLKQFTQSTTIASGNPMTNHFCQTCGTLMYRTGTTLPGALLCRLGTVDDFNLAETKLKPKLEVFTKDRVAWCAAAQIEGIAQYEEQIKL